MALRRPETGPTFCDCFLFCFLGLFFWQRKLTESLRVAGEGDRHVPSPETERGGGVATPQLRRRRPFRRRRRAVQYATDAAAAPSPPPPPIKTTSRVVCGSPMASLLFIPRMELNFHII